MDQSSAEESKTTSTKSLRQDPNADAEWRSARWWRPRGKCASSPAAKKGKRLLCAHPACKGKREITAEDGPVVTIETRETCRRGASNECTREVMKREKCIMVPNGPIKCTKAEEEDHETMVTREKCYHTPTGPRCSRAFEAREGCKPGPTGRPHCTRLFEARAMCRPGPQKPHCGRALDEREMCRIPKGPHCG